MDTGQAPTNEFVRYNAIGPFLNAKEVTYADPARNYFVLHYAGKFGEIGFRSFATPSKARLALKRIPAANLGSE